MADWKNLAHHLNTEDLLKFPITKEDFISLLDTIEQTKRRTQWLFFFPKPHLHKLKKKALFEVFNYTPNISCFKLDRFGFIASINNIDFTHNGYAPHIRELYNHFLLSDEAKSLSVEHNLPLSEIELILKTLILMDKKVLDMKESYMFAKEFSRPQN